MFENILNELNNLQSFKYKYDIPVDEETLPGLEAIK